MGLIFGWGVYDGGGGSIVLHEKEVAAAPSGFQPLTTLAGRLSGLQQKVPWDATRLGLRKSTDFCV